jgi:hypothetical protein
MRILLLCQFIACSVKSHEGDAAVSRADLPSDTAAADTDTPIDSGEVVEDTSTPPPDLTGERVDPPLAAIAFSATNRDGTARSREDLLGHPTVMWFYPAASSYG